ncbi:cullin-associated nedd8-dissociated protein [Salix suchowensis]|nr:cullin-associated nedd8-dissociated protein [Salix suchowensis]
MHSLYGVYTDNHNSPSHRRIHAIITLVEPLPGIFVEPGVLQPTSASKLLYVTPDNVKKCIITLDLKDAGKTQYIVDSNLELTHMHVRRPYDPPDQPLAALHRREFLPDKISFRGGDKIKVKNWLKPLKTFNTLCVSQCHSKRLDTKNFYFRAISPTAFEENGNTYVWDASIVGQLSVSISIIWNFCRLLFKSLQMFKASEPDAPIAWFQGSRKMVVDGVPTVLPAFLVLQPDAADMQDLTVVSFLILEHKARMSSKRTELTTGFMGLNDLMSEIKQDPTCFLGDESVETKVLKQVLSLVEDKISEPRPVDQDHPADQMELVVDRLIEFSGGRKRNCGIYLLLVRRACVLSDLVNHKGH